MSRVRWLSFAATLCIAALLVAAIVREPRRQQAALAEHQAVAIREAVDLYALNCARCHGLAGEGIDINPALSANSVRQKDAAMLANIIARGRYQTDMAAFAISEGGNLTQAQIENLVVLIQQAAWDQASNRAAELDVAASWSPTPTFTLTPSATATPTATLTPSPTATVTPAAAFTLSPALDASAPVFAIQPTAAPVIPELEVVPTSIYPTPPVFDVMPTSAPEGAPFAVLPTATPSQ